MTNHAIITGSLTDIRNIGTDKSLRMTVHVPVELAMTVINCFGWPSTAEPVPVVVARLETDMGAVDMGEMGELTTKIEQPTPGDFVEVET